jgi:hypothetical protein
MRFAWKRVAWKSLVVLVGGCVAVPAQSPRPIDQAKAVSAFAEAEKLSAKDDGKLWGKTLYGPMLFVQPESRAVVANEADGSGLLQKQGDVFVGVLPKDVMIANTAVDWAGKRWTMVMWPLPVDSPPRERLLMHELFHRIEPDLGIPAASPDNAQLDMLEGRILLQLEWRALAAAMVASWAEQTEAIRDALAFAAKRHELFAGSQETERALMLNEGLAEYTGVSIAAPDVASARWRAITRLAAPEGETFVRSFAYASGPAYGLLLDVRLPGWRKRVNAKADLAAMLGGTVTSTSAVAVDQRAVVYGGAALRLLETERDVRSKEEKQKYRKLLADGPTLTLPNAGKFNYSFDPNGLVPLEGLGTVYPTLEVTDAWGALSVQQGALLASDFESVRVAAPASVGGTHLTGPGWTLDVAAGWRVVPGDKAGSFVLKKD